MYIRVLSSSFHKSDVISICSSPITVGGASFWNSFGLFGVPRHIWFWLNEAFQPLQPYDFVFIPRMLGVRSMVRIVVLISTDMHFYTYHKLCRSIEVRPNSSKSIFMSQRLIYSIEPIKRFIYIITIAQSQLKRQLIRYWQFFTLCIISSSLSFLMEILLPLVNTMFRIFPIDHVYTSCCLEVSDVNLH